MTYVHNVQKHNALQKKTSVFCLNIITTYKVDSFLIIFVKANYIHSALKKYTFFAFTSIMINMKASMILF